MVDTVWLTTDKFSINTDNKLEILEKLKRSGELTEKQVCNFGDKDLADKLSAAKLPAQGNMTVQHVGGRQLLMFNVSFPKLLHGHSLAQVTPADFGRCVDAVGRQMAFAGVDMDRQSIVNMNVARIDYCRNITIDGPMPDYLFMLDECMLPHAEKVPQPLGTVLLRNASWQWTAYNKIPEILADTKQRIAAGLTKDTPHNVLRFEYRIIRGANVRRILDGRRTLTDCYNGDLSKHMLLDKFDKLQLDARTKAAVNSSPLAHLFATCSHSAVKDTFAMPLILSMVNNDLDLLYSYLLQRYSTKQAKNIYEQYKAYKYNVHLPAHRDLWQEMRSKLAA